MAEIQIKIIRTCNITKRGKLRKYHPGDYEFVGKRLALQFIADGSAEYAFGHAPGIAVVGAGLITDLGTIPAPLKKAVTTVKQVAAPYFKLDFSQTAFLFQGFSLDLKTFDLGFSFLERDWSVVCPLHDYDYLARDHPDDDARELTIETIGDLRVMVYDTRCMWVRREAATRALFEAWGDEFIQCGQADMAFLRALHRNPVNILALPATWNMDLVRKYEEMGRK